MSENEKEEFAFIKEKIKNKPLNKRRIILKTAFTVVLAVVFGLVSCFVFTWMRPVMEEWLNKPEDTRVSIPKDEEVQPDTEEETNSTETGVDEPDAEEGLKELTPEKYQKLQSKLYAIGSEANKSIVTVTGVTSDVDWFNTPYERQGQASGVIIADTGQELLIMTERKVISGAKSIHVTFLDNSTVEAELKNYDGNTGIAILNVKRSDIEESTLGRIKVAVLGNSLQTTQGSVVLALGSPLGTTFSILTGNITSTSNSISTFDANYNVLTTDIVGSSQGSGVLVNLSGEVVGIVMQNYSSGDENTLTAISVSQLKDIIEKLSNGQDIPYLGLKLTSVTSDIEKEYDIPKGVYIKSVGIDSPAMAAGLQSGDVIVKIAGENVETAQAYKNVLSGQTPGDVVKITIKRQGAAGYVEIECSATVGVLK